MKKAVYMILLAIILMFCSCGREAGSQTDTKYDSEKEESADGLSYKVSIGNTYYFDTMSDADGNIYALTRNDAGNESETSSSIVWETMDDGASWEAKLSLPETVDSESEMLAGGLCFREDKLEAFVFVSGFKDGEMVNRLFGLTDEKTTEYELADMFVENGASVFKISLVNDHVILLMTAEKGIFYDLDAQKVMKELSYDSYTAGSLVTDTQCIIYSNEVCYCLNAQTLENEEAKDSLSKFIEKMYERNGSAVFPPMAFDGEAIVCVTQEAIYEYKNGEMNEIMTIPATINAEKSFNGILPVCKGRDHQYYVCTINDGLIHLLRVVSDLGSKRKPFEIYSLTKNEEISRVAMLFQQEHPELKVDMTIGLKDQAALTRTDAIKQLNTELLAGNGPDVIVMDGLLVNHYIDNDLLSPITSDFSSDDYFINVINSYMADGTLYAIPTRFQLYGVLSRDVEIEKDASLLGEWMLSHKDGIGIHGYENVYQYNTLSQCVQFLYDMTFSDMVIESTASYDAIYSYLDACKQLSDQSSDKLITEAYQINSILFGSIEMHYNPKLRISVGSISNAVDLAAILQAKKQEGIAYALYPSKQAMLRTCDVLAISADTKNKELADMFIDFSMDLAAQETNNMSSLPVSRTVFRKAMLGKNEDAATDDVMMGMAAADGTGEDYLIYYSSKEEVDAAIERIEAITDVFSDDVIVKDIIMDSLIEILSGNMTVGDAAKAASNKINLYLGE